MITRQARLGTTTAPTSASCGCASASRSRSPSCETVQAAHLRLRPVHGDPQRARRTPSWTRLAAEHAHAAAHDPLTGLANRRAAAGPRHRGPRQPARRRRHRAAADRPQPLQGGQRHPRPRRRRPGAASRSATRLRGAAAHRRPGGPARRRRVRRPAHRPARPRGRHAPRRGPARRAARADRRRRHAAQRRGQRRHRASRRAAAACTELLRRADVAMYQAKRSGQRTATYAHARDTADVGRLTLGGDLPRAVAEHEFTVDFQPIVDLGSGEVVARRGAGPLAPPRARQPRPAAVPGDGRTLRPAARVRRRGARPVADRGRHLARGRASTCRSRSTSRRAACSTPRFPGAVLARLRAHDLPPDRLVLELTETLTISQLEVVDRVLGRAARRGRTAGPRRLRHRLLLAVGAVPDPGAPAEDRPRVRDARWRPRPEAAAVIRSTVDLARSLDLTVVAEGVESEPQRHALWELGCAAGQGHLFARPMPRRPAARRAAPRLRRPARHARRRRCTRRARSSGSRRAAGTGHAAASIVCHTCLRDRLADASTGPAAGSPPTSACTRSSAAFAAGHRGHLDAAAASGLGRGRRRGLRSRRRRGRGPARATRPAAVRRIGAIVWPRPGSRPRCCRW